MTTENANNGPTTAPTTSAIPVFTAEEVRKARSKISILLNSLICFGASREMSLVKTNLQQARHWMGDLLGKLGEKNPYNGEKYVPVTDSSDEALSIQGDVKGCTWLREEVGVLASRISEVVRAGISATYEFEKHACLSGAYQSLKQARFWLGEILAEQLKDADSK